MSVVAVGALVWGCTTTTRTAGPPGTTPPRVTAALAPFPSCGAFLEAVRAEADAEVQPWGLPAGLDAFRGGMVREGMAVGAPMAAAGGDAATGASAGPAPSPAFSTTNNQELGVDEPDVVKTDGRLLVALEGDQIHVLQVGTGAPHQVGSLAVPEPGGASGLFLSGSDAVVIGTSWTGTGPETHVWVVSLVDPGRPLVARSFSVDGSFVDARLIGTSVKLVVGFSPRIDFPPSGASVTTMREAIDRAPVSAWLPSITDAAGVRRTAPCAAVEHAADPEGVGTTSVVTFDTTGSEPAPAVSVLGNPTTVYASATDLYVASTSFSTQQALWRGEPTADERTTIHDFDITDPAHATYVGSGAVPGVLLNQYAMSEYAGVLRVATTTGIPTPPPNEGVAPPPADGSQSLVTVLRRSHGSLDQVGQLGGLGRGERIYGVRFVDQLGYVVTYRQLDPLFVVDLTHPAAPVLRGALELTGYSAYLHPVADGLLLGIGASSDGQAHRTGLQVSLFDVGNPDTPRLVARDELPQGMSPVEGDPHAFLWWAPASLAVVPVQQWGSFDGAIVFRAGPSGLSEAGRVTQDGRTSVREVPEGAAPAQPVMSGVPIERSLVVGRTLYTLSAAGVLASDLSTFRDVGWVPFA
jgi:uncharacterized secreted protein with C-terminal beta-propeller domain